MAPYTTMDDWMTSFIIFTFKEKQWLCEERPDKDAVSNVIVSLGSWKSDENREESAAHIVCNHHTMSLI